MKQLLHYLEQFKEIIYFALFISAGIFHKIYEAVKNGKKLSFKWILAEAIISLFVAVTVWAICDQFLHLNKILTYVICAWAGKSSAVFSEKTEDLIGSFFDVLKAYLNIKFTKNE